MSRPTVRACVALWNGAANAEVRRGAPGAVLAEDGTLSLKGGRP